MLTICGLWKLVKNEGCFDSISAIDTYLFVHWFRIPVPIANVHYKNAYFTHDFSKRTRRSF